MRTPSMPLPRAAVERPVVAILISVGKPASPSMVTFRGNPFAADDFLHIEVDAG